MDRNESHEILSNQSITNEMLMCLCGEKIGYGVSRDVYEYNINPDKYVIKIERGNTDSNATEVMLWNEVQGLCGKLAWVKDWFAPILWASPNRKIIVMERTFQKPTKKMPEKVPSFFMDVKEDNFGWIGNRFVCHDYGIIYGFLTYTKGFKKKEWYQSI